MNLLLLNPEDLDDAGKARLSGARAQHILRVLRASVGQVLRAGCLNHSFGRARVCQLDAAANTVHVQYELSAPVSLSTGPDERCLLLAIPRPKVLSRCLEHAAALGYTRIVLLRSARVEKSHLSSHKLTLQDMRPHLLAGLEQGCRVRLPQLEVFDRFRPFVEDSLPGIVQTPLRFVAHPAADVAIAEQRLAHANYCLALGPEGGWVPFEVAALQAAGFVAVRAEMGPLRVESALSYITGQLDLVSDLRRQPRGLDEPLL